MSMSWFTSHFPPLYEFDIAARERSHVVLRSVGAVECFSEQLHMKTTEIKAIALHVFGRLHCADFALWPLNRLPDPGEFEVGDADIVRQVVGNHDITGFNDPFETSEGVHKPWRVLYGFVRDACDLRYLFRDRFEWSD